MQFIELLGFVGLLELLELLGFVGLLELLELFGFVGFIMFTSVWGLRIAAYCLLLTAYSVFRDLQPLTSNLYRMGVFLMNSYRTRRISSSSV